MKEFQIAVDIGGTFTDGVLLDEDEGAIYLAKSLTTPSDPGDGVAAVVADLVSANADASGRVRRVVHRTTLITNTLVERRGVIFTGTQRRRVTKVEALGMMNAIRWQLPSN